MAHDEYNSGLRSGYSSALRILREVDRDIKNPNMNDTWGDGYITYNVSKDLIHKIYALIKEDMEEYTNESDS